MIHHKTVLLFALLLTLVVLTGCSDVKPWQKGNLAKYHMGFDPDPLEARMSRRIYQSKEATAGGFGLAGEGCGCN